MISAKDETEIKSLISGMFRSLNSDASKQDELDFLLNPKNRDKLLDLLLLNPRLKSEVSSKTKINNESVSIQMDNKKGIFKIKINGKYDEYVRKEENMEVYLNCKKSEDSKITIKEYYERDGKKYIIRQVEDINNIYDMKEDEYFLYSNNDFVNIKTEKIIKDKKYNLYGNYYVSSLEDGRLKRNKNVLLEITDDGYLKPANFYPVKQKSDNLRDILFENTNVNTILLDDGKKYEIKKMGYKKGDTNISYNLKSLEKPITNETVSYDSVKQTITNIKTKKVKEIKKHIHDYRQMIIKELINVNAFGIYNKKAIENIISMAYKEGNNVGISAENFFSSFSGNNANKYNVLTKKEDEKEIYHIMVEMSKHKYVTQDTTLIKLYDEYRKEVDSYDKEVNKTSDYRIYNDKEVSYEEIKNRLKAINIKFDKRLLELNYEKIESYNRVVIEEDSFYNVDTKPSEDNVTSNEVKEEDNVTSNEVKEEDTTSNEVKEEDTTSNEVKEEGTVVQSEQVKVLSKSEQTAKELEEFMSANGVSNFKNIIKSAVNSTTEYKILSKALRR